MTRGSRGEGWNGAFGVSSGIRRWKRKIRVCARNVNAGALVGSNKLRITSSGEMKGGRGKGVPRHGDSLRRDGRATSADTAVFAALRHGGWTLGKLRYAEGE